jgi:hypothetical protein
LAIVCVRISERMEVTGWAKCKSDNEGMTEAERIREWVWTWKQYGPELELIRLRDVRDGDQTLSLKQLARAFNHATRTLPPRDTSGLVEMQRYFAKLRR